MSRAAPDAGPQQGTSVNTPAGRAAWQGRGQISKTTSHGGGEGLTDDWACGLRPRGRGGRCVGGQHAPRPRGGRVSGASRRPAWWPAWLQGVGREHGDEARAGEGTVSVWGPSFKNFQKHIEGKRL